MFRISVFTKIILIICFAIILPLTVSNYFIIATYQKFIDRYISGIGAEELKTQFNLFQRSAILQNIVIFILFFLIVFIVFVALSKIVNSPIKKLVEGTREVIRGNLDAKVSIKTKDELEVLADSFNQMVKHLKEAFLKVEEERSRTLGVILNFIDGILVFDEKNCLRIINPEAEKILKVADFKDVVGKNLDDLKKIPSFAPLIKLIGDKEIKQISKKEIRFGGDFAIGSRVSVFEITTVPLPHGEKVFGHLVILYDVSREKFIEKLKSEFISLAAHQLRTPTSVAKWILNSMINGGAGKITGKQKEMLEKAYFNNERMIAVIDDLLNVAKIEEGQFLGVFTKESPKDLIDNAAERYKDLIEKKKIDFKIIVSGEPLPKIEVDKENMILAIENLIENAVKYNLVGGRVTIELNCDKMGLRVKIQDTGMGIPKYQEERVFSKFFRGDNAMRKGTSGTGLGLFIAKSIIEAHGGKIGFKSEENKGSIFWFTLPV